MRFLEGVRLGLSQIRREKLKSFFGLLGVTIGVMFLVVVVSVVEGMDRYMHEDFAQEIFGINTVTVSRTPAVQVGGPPSPEEVRGWARRPDLEPADADALRQGLSVPGLVGVSTSSVGRVRAERNGRTVDNVQIQGISEEILHIRNLQVEHGRPFSPQEARRGVPVVVLGQSTAETLFEDADPLGRRVRIGGFPFRVVGVLEEQGTIFGLTQDNLALAPVASPVRRVTSPEGHVSNIVIQTERREDMDTAMMDAEGVMRVQHGLRPAESNTFELETAEDSMAYWDQIAMILFLALPALVGIALVVGGIVIMNIMLMSVIQRTREIGVRMALGARRRDVVGQFLVESATLSGVGAVLGVALGVGLAALVRAVSPLPAAVAPGWVALGVTLGLVVGIVAGVYPALRASRMDPVEALRYE